MRGRRSRSFGHGMGATMAFECARLLRANGREPQALFVSAQRAPQLPAPGAPIHGLDDDAFLDEVLALGGTDAGVLASDEMRALFMPVLRARIKEARDGGLPDTEAVAVGLQRTGVIVSAPAILLAVAPGVFITGHLVFLKELGVGAAAAVLIDAFAVRALLVPALMRLLGRANRWSPRPLRRLHDRLGLRD